MEAHFVPADGVNPAQLLQNAIDDMAVDIRKPTTNSVVVERQLCMVDAKLVAI